MGDLRRNKKVHFRILWGCLFLLPEQAVSMQQNPATNPFAQSESLTQEEIISDGLPTNLVERDQLLVKIHNEIVPILITWRIQNKIRGFNLYIPFPYNPYREPGLDKKYLLPGSSEKWKEVISSFKLDQKNLMELVQNCFKILTEWNENGFIEICDTDKDGIDVKSVISRPNSYWEEDLQKHNKIANDSKVKLIIQSYSREEKIGKKIKLTQEHVNKITTLLHYYLNQLTKVNAFLMELDPLMIGEGTHKRLVSPEEFFESLPALKSALKAKEPLTSEQNELRILWNKIKPYFLSGFQAPHDLINVKPLQEKTVGDSEIIVLEKEEHIYSSRLVYSGQSKYAHLTEEEKGKETIQIKEGKQKSHSTGVSGIIAASEDLQHIKGVAPGAKVLPVNLNQPSIDLMRKSKARVINMSLGLYYSNACQKYFEERASYVPIGQSIVDSLEIRKKRRELHAKLGRGNIVCANLWDIVQLIEEKDLLLIQAAGNDGVQIEEVNWETGEIQENLTNSAQSIAGYEYKGIPQFTSILGQIPQLRNRIIQVGNLRADGITVAPSSTLPGAFPADFIFAPSEDIKSLRTSEINEGKYGELGEFSGTSGAAPRVAGVADLLGRLFPDLPMTEIRQCILDSGDPFWLLPNNKFTYLKDICGNIANSKINFNDPNWRMKFDPNHQVQTLCANPYGKRLFGQGRVNAMAAYSLCLDKNEQWRKTKNLPDLEKEKYVRNPLQELLLSLKLADPGLVLEVKDYYDTHPQNKIADQSLKKISPLSVAIHLEDKAPGLVKALLGSKNKPKLTKHEATDLMFIALHNKNPHLFPIELYSYLFELGIDVNAVDGGTNTLLHWAAVNGNLAVINLLLERGADVNAQHTLYEEAKGNTALHFAAKEGKKDVVERLLKQEGIQDNPKNAQSKTPKDLARENNHWEVYRLFK